MQMDCVFDQWMFASWKLERHCQNFEGLWSVMLWPVLDDEQLRSMVYLFLFQELLGDAKFHFINRFRASQMCGWKQYQRKDSRQFLIILWLKVFAGGKNIYIYIFQHAVPLTVELLKCWVCPDNSPTQLTSSLSLFSSPVTLALTVGHSYYDVSSILEMACAYALLRGRKNNWPVWPGFYPAMATIVKISNSWNLSLCVQWCLTAWLLEPSPACLESWGSLSQTDKCICCFSFRRFSQ